MFFLFKYKPSLPFCQLKNLTGLFKKFPNNFNNILRGFQELTDPKSQPLFCLRTHLAYSIALVSRITVTLICPG